MTRKPPDAAYSLRPCSRLATLSSLEQFHLRRALEHEAQGIHDVDVAGRPFQHCDALAVAERSRDARRVRRFQLQQHETVLHRGAVAVRRHRDADLGAVLQASCLKRQFLALELERWLVAARRFRALPLFRGGHGLRIGRRVKRDGLGLVA